MYLSRFEINSARRGAYKLLSSPQAMHAAVLAGFPHGSTGAGAGRVLWRVDQSDTQALLYIVSPGRPDLTHLVEQAGWPSTTGWDTRDYDGVLESLSAGQSWAFRLRANPTKSVRLPDKPQRSQRVGHVTVKQQEQWLLDRAERCGFAVSSAENDGLRLAIVGRRVASFDRQGRTVTLSTATYDGQLDVVDPAALRAALVNGIGPAKGYGCGLLTLASVR